MLECGEAGRQEKEGRVEEGVAADGEKGPEKGEASPVERGRPPPGKGHSGQQKRGDADVERRLAAPPWEEYAGEGLQFEAVGGFRVVYGRPGRATGEVPGWQELDRAESDCEGEEERELGGEAKGAFAPRADDEV